MIVEGSSLLGHLSKEGARKMHRFLRESDFSIVCLHVNLNSEGKIMTLAGKLMEQLIRLEQTAHMLVFCRRHMCFKSNTSLA